MASTRRSDRTTVPSRSRTPASAPESRHKSRATDPDACHHSGRSRHAGGSRACRSWLALPTPAVWGLETPVATEVFSGRGGARAGGGCASGTLNQHSASVLRGSCVHVMACAGRGDAASATPVTVRPLSSSSTWAAEWPLRKVRGARWGPPLPRGLPVRSARVSCRITASTSDRVHVKPSTCIAVWCGSLVWH